MSRLFSDAKLTVNLAKSEFCHANLIFHGHIVRQCQLKHVDMPFKSQNLLYLNFNLFYLEYFVLCLFFLDHLVTFSVGFGLSVHLN